MSMESASNSGEDADECSSSESGWTMYIASPAIDGSNVEGDEDGGGQSRQSLSSECGNREEGDDEDDSMASDASSGTPCGLVDAARQGNGGGGVKERCGKYSSRQSADGEKGISRLSQREYSGGYAHGSHEMRRANSGER